MREITPQMLSLIEMTLEEIERIVQRVPGGAQNIQDIYPLAPLAVMWEGPREPAQVVWRKALLRLEEVKLDEKPGDAAEQMYHGFIPKTEPN